MLTISTEKSKKALLMLNPTKQGEKIACVILYWSARKGDLPDGFDLGKCYGCLGSVIPDVMGFVQYWLCLDWT